MSPTPEILINLLEVDKTHLKRQRKIIAACVMIIALLGSMAGVYYTSFRQLSEQQALNKDLKVQIEKNQKLSVYMKANEELKNQLALKQNTVAAVQDMQVSYLDTIEEIARVVPGKMLLTETEIVAGKITIKGYSPNHREVASFLAGLRENPVFKDVQLVSSQTEEEVTEGAEVKFAIEMDWRR